MPYDVICLSYFASPCYGTSRLRNVQCLNWDVYNYSYKPFLVRVFHTIFSNAFFLIDDRIMGKKWCFEELAFILLLLSQLQVFSSAF